MLTFWPLVSHATLLGTIMIHSDPNIIWFFSCCEVMSDSPARIGFGTTRDDGVGVAESPPVGAM